MDDPEARARDLAIVKAGIESETLFREERVGILLRAFQKLLQSDPGTPNTDEGTPLLWLLRYYRCQVTIGSLAAIGYHRTFVLLPRMVVNLIPSRLIAPARLTSPILKLPDELLSLVFSLIYEEQRYDDPSHLLHEPTTLSHVNRKFRSVCISTSYFWSTIVVRKRYPTHQMRVFAQRANTCPLHIHLDLPPNSAEGDDLSSIFDIIRPAARWASFTLLYRERATLDTVMSLCMSSAPSLTDFSLVNMCVDHIEEHLHPPPDIFAAVSLKTLTVIGTPILWSNKTLTRLKRICVQWHPVPMKATIEDWTAFLRASPYLESLLIKGSGPFIPDDFDLSRQNCMRYTVELTYLKELRISHLLTDAFTFLLHTVTAPNLESFELSDALIDLSDTDSELFHSLAQMNQIRKLRIERTTVLDDVLIALLSIFGNVEILELFGPDEYLQAITTRDASGPTMVVPKLRQLTVRCHSVDAVSDYMSQRDRLGARVGELALDEYDEDGLFNVLETWATSL